MAAPSHSDESSLELLQECQSATLTPTGTDDNYADVQEFYTCVLYNSDEPTPESKYAKVTFNYDVRKSLIDVYSADTGHYLFQIYGETEDWQTLALRYHRSKPAFARIAPTFVYDLEDKPIMRCLPISRGNNPAFKIDAPLEGQQYFSTTFAMITILPNEVQLKLDKMVAKKGSNLLRACFLTLAFRLERLKHVISHYEVFDENALRKHTNKKRRLETVSRQIDTHPTTDKNISDTSGLLNQLNDFMLKKCVQQSKNNLYIIKDSSRFQVAAYLVENLGSSAVRNIHLINISTGRRLFTFSISPKESKHYMHMEDNPFGYVEDLGVFDCKGQCVMDADVQYHDEHKGRFSVFYRVCFSTPKEENVKRPSIAIISADQIQGYVRTKVVGNISVADKIRVISLATFLNYSQYQMHLGYTPNRKSDEAAAALLTNGDKSMCVLEKLDEDGEQSANSTSLKSWENLVTYEPVALVKFAESSKEELDYLKVQVKDKLNMFFLKIDRNKQTLELRPVNSEDILMKMNNLFNSRCNSVITDSEDCKVGSVFEFKLFDSDDRQTMVAEYKHLEPATADTGMFSIFSRKETKDILAELQVYPLYNTMMIYFHPLLQPEEARLILAFAVKAVCTTSKFITKTPEVERASHIMCRLRTTQTYGWKQGPGRKNRVGYPNSSGFLEPLSYVLQPIAKFTNNGSYLVHLEVNEEAVVELEYIGDDADILEARLIHNNTLLFHAVNLAGDIYSGKTCEIYDRQLDLIGFTKGLNIKATNEQTFTASLDNINEEVHSEKNFSVKDQNGAQAATFQTLSWRQGIRVTMTSKYCKYIEWRLILFMIMRMSVSMATIENCSLNIASLDDLDQD